MCDNEGRAAWLAAAAIVLLLPYNTFHQQFYSQCLETCPHTSTPRLPCTQLAKENTLNLKHVRHFILDECDKMLEALGAWLLLF